MKEQAQNNKNEFLQTDRGETKSNAIEVPSISVPKGGGAIRGIGEKFSANPVTGTSAFSIPVFTSPGRGNFGPQLSLSYDSGAGNGPFGFGWSMSIPSIDRKTSKGLPVYRDTIESDVFILAGAEDLVPVLMESGAWLERREAGYTIRRYQPRVEGLFAHIERWTDAAGACHWRSVSRDNITSIYGSDHQSRIFDPADPRPEHPTSIFKWLLRETYDDKGNVIRYEYAAENDAGVDLSQNHERNRTRTANRYIKRILYSNRTSRLAGPDWEADGFLFEVVFDYGEGYLRELPWQPETPAGQQQHRVQVAYDSTATWPARPDPFSSYRSGFELRTCRRCEQVLMFHHFDELIAETSGQPCLVRTTEFHYNDLNNPDATIEAELAHQGSTRIASFIQAVTQSGFVYDANAENETVDGIHYLTYLKKSLPPLEFQYSKATIDDQVHRLDAGDLENLPQGLDQSRYRFVDLDAEGASGILTEQGDAWYYKASLGGGHFAPMVALPTKPNVSLTAGRQQLVDLSGNGQLDVVAFEGPMAGFYERTQDGNWQPFRTFRQTPNIRWDNPNTQFVDLNGDGRADVLITENDVFTWYTSRGEEGFDEAAQVRQPLDEEQGPRLIMADGTQSIYLSDLSGDGLIDLLRIRNGEICYWPNLGHGRFGRKVTMDNAPRFDHPDCFDQQRIRLTDIDGSGTTDILYLHRDGVRLYFNQSGNRWSAARQLLHFPSVDNLSSVTVADFKGNGTACLVWSSPLPGDAGSPLRYIDLMGGQKPHLLEATNNNLGLETRIHYVASSKFYLEDKLAGTPWITRIPFPVHCVEKVTVTDRWRKATFATTYSYHHGYFDGHERDFHGFGRVEQVDSEIFDIFAEANTNSPYIIGDQELYQPPIKTVTWYHTGALLDRQPILNQYAREYFPTSFENRDPGATRVMGGFAENTLPQPDLQAEALTAEEWREAVRACKGMTLRQEVYELDVQALANGQHQPVKIYSAANHNCNIRKLQGKGRNRHAVFLVTESEAITYHYELDLTAAEIHPDPRVAHTLNLRTDEYGNVLESVAVAYPRIGRHEDTGLPDGAQALIAQVQRERHLVYTENRFTQDVITADHYRLRLPCEVKTHELTGLNPRAGFYYSLAELRLANPAAAAEIPYHVVPDRTTLQKRSVEQVRMLYFAEDMEHPLPLGELNHLGLAYETYKLALTAELLEAVFLPGQLTPAVHGNLAIAGRSGYLSGATLAEHFPEDDTRGQYWVRSGIAGFDANPATRFYLPERYTDAFGHTTSLEYDRHRLFHQANTDPLGNRTEVLHFDYRVLAPKEIRDPNNNLTEAVFDILGSPAAVAVKGKGDEGDHLEPFLAATAIHRVQPPVAQVAAVFLESYQESSLRTLLGTASARHLYWFGETVNPDTGAIRYSEYPAGSCGIMRETHQTDLPEGVATPLQIAFEYSDGGGNVLATKLKAEPAAGSTAIRWLTNGKTLLNNKGKPVKQYEPYFSSNEQRFEELHAVGVSPTIYYDVAGRVVRTEMPDGSYSRVAFSPWFMAAWDANDTVLEPGNPWFARMGSDSASPEDRRAATLAAFHADTPAVTHLDSLSREVIAIAHNRTPSDALEWRNTPLSDRPWLDEKSVTYNRLDAQGKPLWIQDARGNRVMEYINRPGADTDFAPCYDIAGNLLFQHSMDGGDRWMLMDSTGQPFYAWDRNERAAEDGSLVNEHRVFHTTYDRLHRPLEQRLSINGGDWQTIERFTYGETHPETLTRNLRGQLHWHDDASGRITNDAFDFKGNLLEVRRQLVGDAHLTIVDWSAGLPPGGLGETFTQRTQYDALNRMTQLENWHLPGRTPAIYTPQYNQRGLLESESLSINGNVTQAVRHIEYDAKGQRMRIAYGNNTETRYDYDPLTFRLKQLRTTRPVSDLPFPNFRSNLRDDRVVQQLHYTYDAVGNITEIVDEAYEPVFFRNQIVEPQSRYTYDALYQLIEATGRENYHAAGAPPQRLPESLPVTFPLDRNVLRNYTQRYIYDSVGNFMEMRHSADRGSWTRHYETAPDSNRLLRTWTGNGDSDTVHYEYDTHGSMLNLNRTPEEYRLRWDYRDMIHTANLAGGGWAYYNYDAGKQRTRKRIERLTGEIEERLYLGGMERYRRWRGGSLMEEIETHHLFVDDQRVLIVEDVRTSGTSNLPEGVLLRYQYSNHLGSVGLELNVERYIISYEEYHPYGTTAYRAKGNAVHATAKRYRYTGMERDEESGLNYHTARYYLPWLGKWCSVDPKGLIDGINLFIVMKNNPIRFSDDNGSQTIERDMDAGVAMPLLPGGIDADAGASISEPPPVTTSGPRIELYGQRIWLENVTPEQFRGIEAEVTASIAAGSIAEGGPAGVSAIRLTNGAVYFWNRLELRYEIDPGIGQLDRRSMDALQERLQALQTSLEYYALTLEFSVGVATGISVGPRLLTAVGLSAGREAGEQATMSLVIAPLIDANIEDPATASILILASGVLLGATISRARSTPRGGRPAIPDDPYSPESVDLRVTGTRTLSQQLADDIGDLGLSGADRSLARQEIFRLADQIGSRGYRTLAELEAAFPNRRVHQLTGNFRGWISIDPVAGNPHAFRGGRLLVRPGRDGIEFMVRNTH